MARKDGEERRARIQERERIARESARKAREEKKRLEEEEKRRKREEEARREAFREEWLRNMRREAGMDRDDDEEEEERPRRGYGGQYGEAHHHLPLRIPFCVRCRNPNPDPNS